MIHVETRNSTDNTPTIDQDGRNQGQHMSNLFDGYQTVMNAAARALEPDPVQPDDLARIVSPDGGRGLSAPGPDEHIMTAAKTPHIQVACIHQESTRDRPSDGVTRQHAGGALEILARVACGEPVDPDEARQLLNAVAVAGRDDFMRALGVDRPTRVRMRDRALMAASKSLFAVDPWAAAKQLVADLDRFHSRVLPLVRKGRPLEDLGDREKALLIAHWSATSVTPRIETLYRLFR